MLSKCTKFIVKEAAIFDCKILSGSLSETLSSHDMMLINYEMKGAIKPLRTSGGVRRYRVEYSMIEEKKNEYKRSKLRKDLRKLKRELKHLIKFLLDSGESEPATQQTAIRKMEQLMGHTKVGQKSWRVLPVALAFSCLEDVNHLNGLDRSSETKRDRHSFWSGNDYAKYV